MERLPVVADTESYLLDIAMVLRPLTIAYVNEHGPGYKKMKIGS